MATKLEPEESRGGRPRAAGILTRSPMPGIASHRNRNRGGLGRGRERHGRRRIAGPVTAAVGAALGAVAGGLAGKGLGELIDPTTEDNWLRDNSTRGPMSRRARPSTCISPSIDTARKPRSEIWRRRIRRRSWMIWEKDLGPVARSCRIEMAPRNAMRSRIPTSAPPSSSARRTELRRAPQPSWKKTEPNEISSATRSE